MVRTLRPNCCSAGDTPPSRGIASIAATTDASAMGSAALKLVFSRAELANSMATATSAGATQYMLIEWPNSQLPMATSIIMVSAGYTPPRMRVIRKAVAVSSTPIRPSIAPACAVAAPSVSRATASSRTAV